MRISFTPENATFLFGLIRSKIAVIDSMKSDTQAHNEKKQAWNEIVLNYNLRFSEHKITPTQALDKWRAHKKRAKATSARQRAATMATGNVTSIEDMDPEEEKTLATINDSIKSINYPNDSDKVQMTEARLFPESDGDEGAISLPKVSKSSSSQCPKSVLVDLKRIQHEAEMENLRRADERSRLAEERSIDLYNRQVKALEVREERERKLFEIAVERSKKDSTNPFTHFELPKDFN